MVIFEALVVGGTYCRLTPRKQGVEVQVNDSQFISNKVTLETWDGTISISNQNQPLNQQGKPKEKPVVVVSLREEGEKLDSRKRASVYVHQGRSSGSKVGYITNYQPSISCEIETFLDIEGLVMSAQVQVIEELIPESLYVVECMYDSLVSKLKIDILEDFEKYMNNNDNNIQLPTAQDLQNWLVQACANQQKNYVKETPVVALEDLFSQTSISTEDQRRQQQLLKQQQQQQQQQLMQQQQQQQQYQHPYQQNYSETYQQQDSPYRSFYTQQQQQPQQSNSNYNPSMDYQTARNNALQHDLAPPENSADPALEALTNQLALM